MEKKETLTQRLGELCHTHYKGCDMQTRLEDIVIDNSDWYELDDGSDLQYIDNDKQLIKDLMLEIDKAREEGRRYQRELDEMINGITIEDSTLERGKEYFIISKEAYEELSKLKDNKQLN